MHPRRLTIMMCMYTVNFFILYSVFYTCIPEEWVFRNPSILAHAVENYGKSGPYTAGLLILSLIANSLIIMLTAKTLLPIIRKKSHAREPNPTKFRTTLIWYAFFIIYLIISILLAKGLPEAWLHWLFMGHRNMTFDNVVWDETYISLVFALALPMTGVVVALVSSLLLKRRSRGLTRNPRGSR